METLHSERVIAGKYRLERQLATGGMGAIWVARHLQLETDVAVKLMDVKLAQSPAARERFAREAKAAARLHGPHKVGAHDYGVDDESPVMEQERRKGGGLGKGRRQV